MNNNKILNLNRLGLKNGLIVLSYLLKRIFKLEPSQKENDLYFFYMHLIASDGHIVDEYSGHYIVRFKNGYDKKLWLRKKPSSDILVYNQIYGYKEYAPVVEAYNNSFKNDKDYRLNIIDAGANIGLTSVYFLEHFNKPNIITVEPESHNFAVLSYNLSNANGGKVTKLNAGIWNTDSMLKIVSDFRDKSDWAFRVEETGNENGLRAYSINTLIKDNEFDVVDILKIDIEGSEKEVFTSPQANLDFLHKTRCIAVEIHDEFKCRESIYKVLTQYGFSYFDDGESTIGINQNLTG